MDWPKIKVVPAEEETETATTFAAVLLPQPLDESSATAASPAPTKLQIEDNFVTTISPTLGRPAVLLGAPILVIVRKNPSVQINFDPAIHAAIKTFG